MVKRFRCRIEDVLRNHRVHNGEDLEQTTLRYVASYNQELPHAALTVVTPVQAMIDWQKLRSERFRKQPYYLTGFVT